MRGGSVKEPLYVQATAVDPVSGESVNGTSGQLSFSVGAIITPAASCTDLATLVGSATKKVRVKRICISGTQTTGGQVIVQIIKRTAANTGGTATQPTPVRHRTAGGAPTAVFNAYTANPSGLGAGATARVQRVPVGATTVTTNNIVCIDLADNPIELDGVAEALAVNLNAVTVTGGSLHISVEWTEGS